LETTFSHCEFKPELLIRQTVAVVTILFSPLLDSEHVQEGQGKQMVSVSFVMAIYIYIFRDLLLGLG